MGFLPSVTRAPPRSARRSSIFSKEAASKLTQIMFGGRALKEREREPGSRDEDTLSLEYHGCGRRRSDLLSKRFVVVVHSSSEKAIDPMLNWHPHNLLMLFRPTVLTGAYLKAFAVLRGPQEAVALGSAAGRREASPGGPGSSAGVLMRRLRTTTTAQPSSQTFTEVVESGVFPTGVSGGSSVVCGGGRSSSSSAAPVGAGSIINPFSNHYAPKIQEEKPALEEKQQYKFSREQQTSCLSGEEEEKKEVEDAARSLEERRRREKMAAFLQETRSELEFLKQQNAKLLESSSSTEEESCGGLRNPLKNHGDSSSLAYPTSGSSSPSCGASVAPPGIALAPGIGLAGVVASPPSSLSAVSPEVWKPEPEPEASQALPFTSSSAAAAGLPPEGGGQQNGLRSAAAETAPRCGSSTTVSTTVWEVCGATTTKGEVVEALYAGNGSYYPARVIQLLPDRGKALLEWHDKDPLHREVPLSNLLRPKRKENTLHPGTIPSTRTSDALLPAAAVDMMVGVSSSFPGSPAFPVWPEEKQGIMAERGGGGGGGGAGAGRGGGKGGEGNESLSSDGGGRSGHRKNHASSPATSSSLSPEQPKKKFVVSKDVKTALQHMMEDAWNRLDEDRGSLSGGASVTSSNRGALFPPGRAASFAGGCGEHQYSSSSSSSSSSSPLAPSAMVALGSASSPLAPSIVPSVGSARILSAYSSYKEPFCRDW